MSNYCGHSSITSPSRGRLFSISALETEAMGKYNKDSLASEISRPSSSPAGAGFLFNITIKISNVIPWWD